MNILPVLFILATHLNQAAHRPISNSRDEAECESDWPRLRTQLEATAVIAPWWLRVRAENSTFVAPPCRLRAPTRV